MDRLRFGALLLSVVLSAGCSVGAARGEGAPQPSDSVFGDLKLVDHEARPLTAAVMHANTLVVNFVFTSCPTVCPRKTRELAGVQRALEPKIRSRVRFLSVSVDPSHDTPAKLKQFALAHGADLNGWWFASAAAADTERLAARLRAFDARAQNAPAGHTTAIYLFDTRGRVMQRYTGAPIDQARLVREIEQLDRIRGAGRLPSS